LFCQSQGWLKVVGMQVPDGLQLSTLSVGFILQLAAATLQAAAQYEQHASRQTSHLVAGTQYPAGAGST